MRKHFFLWEISSQEKYVSLDESTEIQVVSSCEKSFWYRVSLLVRKLTFLTKKRNFSHRFSNFSQYQNTFLTHREPFWLGIPYFSNILTQLFQQIHDWLYGNGWACYRRRVVLKMYLCNAMIILCLFFILFYLARLRNLNFRVHRKSGEIRRNLRKI